MVTPIKGRGGPGRGQGRKALPEGEAMVPVSIKMRPDQRDKLSVLGGPQWVRNKIDAAKVPQKPRGSGAD